MPTKSSRRKRPVLGVLRLEDRTVPATSITIVSGSNSSGSLDSFLSDATPGVIDGTDGGSVAGTLSSGALAAVTSTTNISVTAQTSITINNLSAALALQTGAGRTASLIAQGGALTFANVANTLSTAGGGLTLTASTNETIGQLATGGGSLNLTASAGTLTQSGTANAGAGVVNVSASGNLTMAALTGSTVTLTSTGGAINSAGTNRIVATTRLNLSARTGITLNTQAASIQAGNSMSGNISVTQAATPAQALTTAGTGVVNSVAGRSVTLTNLGAAIAVASGAPVQSSNGPVTLAALDFTIAGAVNSGTGRTTLANATAGRQFDLGTNTAGKVGLTQTELNNVTAGVLQVGSGTAGTITLSAAIGPFAGSNTLAIVTNDVLSQGATSLTVPNLRVSSPQVGLAGANNVGTLAASVSGGNFVFDANIPLNIGTVDGASGVVTTGASVALFADALDVQQAINAGTGLVQISTFTSGRPVSLGTEVSGQLSLTDTELGRVTAGILRVGTSATPGSIAINSTLTRHAGYNTLSLNTGGTVTQSAALSVVNLAATSTGGVTLTNAGNDVDILAAQVTGSGNGFSYTDANALAVGTVDAVNGITTNAGPVTLTTVGSITDGNGTATNVTASSLTANAVTSVDLDTDVGPLSINLTGAGAITLTEAGTATIGSLNPGIGTITLSGGTFDLGGSNAMTGNLIVAGATLNLGALVQIMTSVVLTGGSIIGTGTISSVFDFDVRSGSVGAKLGGGVGLNKTTTGTVTLSGANTYAGTTTVSGGTLLINGSLAPSSSVTVNSGGTLGGTGTVAAAVTVNSGGTLAPGTGPGIIRTGNLQSASGTTFTIELNGPYTTAGTDYDCVTVTGTLTLNSATLTLVGGTTATVAGQVLTIISNDGTDPVVGTFSGRQSGSTVSVGSFLARISYTGGDGNDVTLTTLTTPPAVVQSVTIDNGTAQRSMVRSATVRFDRLVNFSGALTTAFQLARTGPGTPTGNVTLAVDLSGSTATQTVARLTFSGSLTEGANSLVDGNYTLTVFNTQIQGGIQGGNNVTSLYRLYGDVNGDRAVNGVDLTAFRNAFGTVSADAGYVSFLDFNGDGAINGTDLTQFRNRFGVILP